MNPSRTAASCTSHASLHYTRDQTPPRLGLGVQTDRQTANFCLRQAMSNQHPRNPPRQPYAEKFLFVNYDSSSPCGSHDPSQVLSHVRRNYHVWRRKQSAQHLRDSILVPRSSKQKVLLPSFKRSPASESSPDVPGGPVFTKPKGASKTRRTDASVEAITGLTLGPSSITLRSGNSDPFNAHAVKINPGVNELIAFYRDYLLPAQYHVPSTTWVSSANARLDWSICVSTLQDPALANAFIARSATVAAVLNPALRTVAMRYRLRSIQELRVRLLNKSSHICSDANVLQIIMLQKSEIVDKNLSAAAAHAKILQIMFQEQQKRNCTVNFTLLQYALWSDTQISSIFMTPLAFDVSQGGWVVETMQPLWDAALEQLRELPQWTAILDEAEKSMDPSIEGVDLKAFFISRRTTLQTWLLYGLNGLPTPPLIVLWLTTTACLQQGRMIKHYIGAVREVDQITSSPSAKEEGEKGRTEQAEYWCTQQYLILAEFLWTHHLSYKVEVCGIDLFDMVPTQLRNLRGALQHAEVLGQGPGHSCSSKYRNARLWALFIGAHAELLKSNSKSQKTNLARSPKNTFHNKPLEKVRSPALTDCIENMKYRGADSQREISVRWFETQLARQIQDMGLSTWLDVYSVLRGFNYADVIQPLGEEIFNKAMNRI